MKIKENSPPKVTVAIPTFNRLPMLRKAIDSVLKQDYKNFEIIVSDNASDDGTAGYLSTLNNEKIRIILGEKNVGMVANWDRCLDASGGEYFILLSDDDEMSSISAIAKLVQGFECCNTTIPGFVFSDVLLSRDSIDIYKKNKKIKVHYTPDELVLEYYKGNVTVLPSATLFRTKDLRGLGGYSQFGAKLAVDACAWISIAFNYGVVLHVAEPLIRYRIHNSMSWSSMELTMSDYSVMKSLIEKNKNKCSFHKYDEIIRAMNNSRNIIPVGYIIQKIRGNVGYGLKEAFIDVYAWRKCIFNISNFTYLLKSLLRKMVEK